MPSQLDCLTQALIALSRSGLSPAAASGLRGILARLPFHTSPATRRTTGPPSPADVLALVCEARASARLLGLLVPGGPLGHLGPVLEAVDAEQRLEMRREVSERLYGLYVIIDPRVTADRDPLEVARAALEGGARILQLRDKVGDKGQSLPLAVSLRELCGQYDALLMVNDHADVAALSGAHGLHVGQTDLPVAKARRVLGPGQIIGRSNHLLGEVMESQTQGADHVALGNVYRTSTKESIRNRPPLGPEAVKRAKAALDVPLVAIGGINEDNVGQVVRAGADAVCVASAVGLASDPAEASRRLIERMSRAGGKV